MTKRTANSNDPDEDPFIAEWKRWPEREEFLRQLGGDEGLAFHIFLGLGDQSIAWLDREIPALDHQQPRELLETRQGRRRLRSISWLR